MSINTRVLLTPDRHIIQYEIPGTNRNLEDLQLQYPHSFIELVANPSGLMHGYFIDTNGVLHNPQSASASETIHTRRDSVEAWAAPAYRDALLHSNTAGLGTRDSFGHIRNASIVFQGYVFNILWYCQNDANLLRNGIWDGIQANMYTWYEFVSSIDADNISAVIIEAATFFDGNVAWIESESELVNARIIGTPDTFHGDLDDTTAPQFGSADDLLIAAAILGIPQIPTSD